VTRIRIHYQKMARVISLWHHTRIKLTAHLHPPLGPLAFITARTLKMVVVLRLVRSSSRSSLPGGHRRLRWHRIVVDGEEGEGGGRDLVRKWHQVGFAVAAAGW
jgi:hypothetical protein